MKLLVRLISPLQRRIVFIDRANPKHALTHTQLATLGWTEYAGQAQVDARGWIIPGTDPELRTVPASIRRNHG